MEDINDLVEQNLQKLQDEHANNYNGTDDDMPDAFNDWLVDLEVKDITRILTKGNL